MKNFLLFGAIALSALTFGQNIPNYVPTNGLVGWWPFNGNANDESGNGNNGTVNGATLTTDRNGAVNSAYSFNGIDNYIETFINYGNDFSISFWLNSGNYKNYNNQIGAPVISTLNNNDGWPNNWETGFGKLDSTYWVGNGKDGINIKGGIKQNVWCNIIITYNSNNKIIEIFKNSTNNNSSYFEYNKTTNRTIFGGRANSPVNFFYEGKLDDIAIFNRVLTQQEITALYTGTPPCTTPTATITPQSNTSFCQGGSVVLESTSGNYTYQWYKNGNSINGETNQTYTATTSGNYSVKVIDRTCDATSSTTTVTVNANPNVSFSLPSFIHNENGNYTLNGSPSGGSYSGNGITGNILDLSTIGLGKQTIVYDYTDNNGCSGSKTASTIIYDTTGTVCKSYVSVSVTDTLIMDVSLAGVSAPNDVNRMKVYPNPSNDIVNIDNGNYALMNGYSVKIMNALGQEVFSSAINSQLLQVSVNQLGSLGSYFINVYDNNQNLLESKVLVLQ